MPEHHTAPPGVVQSVSDAEDPISGRDAPQAPNWSGIKRGRDGDLWFEKYVAHGTHWRPLCSPLSPVNSVCNERRGDWGVVANVATGDGGITQVVIARGDCAPRSTSAIRQLLSAGLVMHDRSPAAYEKLLAFLASGCDVDGSRLPVKVAIPRLGWTSDRLHFLTPHETFSASAQRDVTTTIRPDIWPLPTGTLTAWRDDVAAPCGKSTRGALAICAAFAAPLLRPMQREGFIVHIFGPSSTGKTTILQAAASVWGQEPRTWSATANGLEAAAAVHNDTLLCLDELGLVAPEDAARTAYTIPQGVGRIRARDNGDAAHGLAWRTIGLSTGEITLAAKIAEGRFKQRRTAGQEVRVIEVPVGSDAGGVFDLLSTADAGASRTLSDGIARAARSLRGVAGPAFMRWIIPRLGDVRDGVRNDAAAFCASIGPTGGRQVERVAQAFGILAAAGEAAIRAGVLPWAAGSASEGARACFEAWRGARGGDQDRETVDLIDRVRRAIEQDAARFQKYGDKWTARPVANRLGYVQTVAGERQLYYFTQSGWEEVVGADVTGAARKLAALGIVRRSEDDRFMLQARPEPGARGRFYVVDRNALAEGA